MTIPPYHFTATSATQIHSAHSSRSGDGCGGGGGDAGGWVLEAVSPVVLVLRLSVAAFFHNVHSALA